MASGQAVRRAVKADIEGSFAIVDEVFDFLFVRDLSNQAAGFQFVINRHFGSSCAAGKTKPPAK